jgi:thymidylate synthase
VLNRRPPTIFAYTFEDIEIAGYQSHPGIRAPVAV